MGEPIKNIFNQQYVSDLADAVQGQYPPFDKESFIAQVIDDDWEARELKERMRHISTVLHDFLPGDYRPALDILRQTAPKLSQYGFASMVFSDYVEVYGLDDYDASIPALEQFTQQISAEFAVRPFIIKYQDRMLAQMLAWARSDNGHLRRLASEGCRPRLPWGVALPALKADPSPILPILELLKQDESETVRRSVANNLNDISKDNPEVVIEVLQNWQAHDTEEIRAITRHALRTLLKAGHPEALALLGYPPPAIAVKNLSIEPETVPFGGNVTFSFDIESMAEQPQDLMIDYVVYLMRANGKQTPKVFKLSKRVIQPGEVIHIERKLSFEPVTTRKYYPGAHAIEPKINGKAFGMAEFVVG
jgi:3-methyladenine DNA glycosylase AlkC